jgi:hypothetical protein
VIGPAGPHLQRETGLPGHLDRRSRNAARPVTRAGGSDRVDNLPTDDDVVDGDTQKQR